MQTPDQQTEINRWRPDRDPDYGTPVSQYPAPLTLQPIVPGQRQSSSVAPANVGAKDSPSLNYQHGGERQYAWVQPPSSRPMRNERQEVQFWATLIGITFLPSLLIFGNIGAGVCLALWCLAGLRRFLSCRPRLLGIELNAGVLVIIALLGYILYLYYDNGLLFNWELMGLFVLTCILCWARLRYNLGERWAYLTTIQQMSWTAGAGSLTSTPTTAVSCSIRPVHLWPAPLCKPPSASQSRVMLPARHLPPRRSCETIPPPRQSNPIETVSGCAPIVGLPPAGLLT